GRSAGAAKAAAGRGAERELRDVALALARELVRDRRGPLRGARLEVGRLRRRGTGRAEARGRLAPRGDRLRLLVADRLRRLLDRLHVLEEPFFREHGCGQLLEQFLVFL